MANSLYVAGTNSVFHEPGADPAGFFTGLWHGIIMPITFLISLFNPEVSIYEPKNNGGWYDFGYVLGAGSTLKVSSDFGHTALECGVNKEILDQ